MHDRLARALLISQVLAADGEMTSDERRFLERSMDALKLTESERSQALERDGREQAEPILARLDEKERRAFMEQLTHAVLADGKVTPAEMALINKLSAALGLS